jgi:ABC-type multidrug transport system ATPase subunit
LSAPIIECKDIHKWFGEFHALKGINMEVEKGEVVVIFGPSGSGKSTFIRTINRLEEHQRGQIIVDGIELNQDIHNIEKIREEMTCPPKTDPKVVLGLVHTGGRKDGKAHTIYTGADHHQIA